MKLAQVGTKRWRVKLEMKFRKMRQAGLFSCKMHCPHSCKPLQNNEFVRGMIPARQAVVMKAADYERRRSDSLTGQMPGDSQRIINAWIIGNSFAIVLVLALFALWFATSGFSWPGNVWQLAVIVPTTLVVLLLIMLIEKSRMRNSEALQVKLDQRGDIRVILDHKNAPRAGGFVQCKSSLGFEAAGFYSSSGFFPAP